MTVIVEVSSGRMIGDGDYTGATTYLHEDAQAVLGREVAPVLVGSERALDGLLDLLLAGLVVDAEQVLVVVRRPDLASVASPHLPRRCKDSISV